MSNPFMQLYVADYLGDTRHLTTEQHGAYLLLLMTMWRADGYLPNDAKKLARIAGCTPSRWSKIADDVMAFFDVDGDQIFNKRLMFELEKASEKSIKRAEAGTKGGHAKARKTLNAPVANASRLPKHSSEPEPETEETSSSVVPLPPKPKPSRRAPEDWSPKETTLSTLMAEGYDSGSLERALAMVRDHEFAKPKTDWDATYRIWVRRDPPRGSHGKHPSIDRPDARHEARLDNHAAHWTGAERAADIVAARRAGY